MSKEYIEAIMKRYGMEHTFECIKIPYKKIIGVNPYSDGIEIHRDGATAKRLTMQGFDPWFLMNLLSMIAE